MLQKKNILFLFIYTLLFSLLLFIGRSIFFSAFEEEQYVEPSLYSHDFEQDSGEIFESFTGVTQGEVKSAVASLIYEEFSQKYNQRQREKVQLRYVPEVLFNIIEYSYVPIAETFLYSKSMLSKIEELGLFFYKNRADTRGRMKAEHIHIYGVESLSLEEFLGVLIHEFAHYIDIYSLPRTAFGDESQRFYDISWEKVNHIKSDLTASDFVSGYAMTNQYEDFAETYLFYVLHNREFLEKTKTSSVLAKKYSFFQTYIFERNMFHKESFSLEQDIKNYYWDITKLKVDIKKFLQYMQSDI